MADQGYHGQPDLTTILADIQSRLSRLERTRTIPTGSGAPPGSPADGAQYGDATDDVYWVRLNGDWVAYGRGGADTVTWPGGSRLTTATTVTHNLGSAPTRITLGSASSNMGLSYTNITLTTFDVIGNTMDGTSPAAATVRAFSWEASL